MVSPSEEDDIFIKDEADSNRPTGPVDLRRKVRILPRGAPSPIEKAEQRLAQLEVNFGLWLADYVKGITAVWSAGVANKDDLEKFGRLSAELRGHAISLDYPLLSRVAHNMYLLTQVGETEDEELLVLLDNHILSINAIVREDARTAENLVGNELVETLSILAEQTRRKLEKIA